MNEEAPPKKYPFPWPDQDKGYSLFPHELENDELVAFHGTSEMALRPIIENGFKFGGALQSVSFARQSSLALNYGSSARTPKSPIGCVLLVRFSPPIPRQGIVVEPSVIHVYKLEELPKVIGYCIIPQEYIFQ